MHVHRILTLIKIFFPCLILLIILTSCGKSTPSPVQTRTPTQSATVTPVVIRTPVPTSTVIALSESVYTLISTENVAQLKLVSQTKGSDAFQWSPDGKHLLVSTYQQMTLVDLKTGEVVWSSDSGYSVDFSRDGKWIAVVDGAEVKFLESATGAVVRSSEEDECAHSRLVRFHPDHQRVVLSDGLSVSILDRQDMICHLLFQVPGVDPWNGTVKDLVFSPDGKTLLAVANNQITLWSMEEKRIVGQRTGFYAVFHPNGRWLAVGSADGLILYDWASLKPIRTFPEYQHRAISFSPDGSLLVAGSPDGTSKRLNFYHVTNGALLASYRDLPVGLMQVSFFPDGRQLLALTGTNHWEAPTYLLNLAVLAPDHAAAPLLPEAAATSTPWYQEKPLRLATQLPPRFPLLSQPLVGPMWTPTPIHTPDGKEHAHRLNAWSETDGITLIRDMVDYAHASDVYGPSTSRPGFTEMQAPIRTAALEYLLRFPRSIDAPAVRWRLALADAIIGRSDSDRWITSQIEQALNSRVISPEEVNSWLKPYGFTASPRICPIPSDCSWADDYGDAVPIITSSLFDDGGKTLLIQIGSVELVTGKMVAALHQDPKGRYYLLPVYSGWKERYLDHLQAAVQDLTGDGRPEVWVEQYTHSGSMWDQTSLIYYWEGDIVQGGRFREVTGGQIYSGINSNYQLIPGGEQGQPGTIAYKDSYWNYFEQVSLRWNGSYFIPADNKVLFPIDTDRLFSGVLARAMSNGQYEEVDAFLQQPPNPKNPAEADFRAFQRAVNTALQFKNGETIALLQSILQKPAAPNSAFLKVVQAYRTNYRQATDLYQACQAALTTYADVTADYQDDQGSISWEEVGKAFGFPVDYETSICDSNTAFRQLVNRSNLTHPAQIPDQLAKYGVHPSFITQLEGNNDGKPDWLLILDRPNPSRYWQGSDIWLILSGSAHVELVYLDAVKKSNSRSRFERLPLPGSDRNAFLLQHGESLLVFRLYPGEGGTAVERLLDVYRMADYQVDMQSDAIKLVITRDPAKETLQSIVQWDTDQNQFVVYAAQEQELLLLGHAQTVIQTISTLLTRMDVPPNEYYDPRPEQARLNYLLGLAYELTGDAENAARVYYHLWQTYPDQPYGIMAREKIELVQP